jgi:hypothetical protein
MASFFSWSFGRKVWMQLKSRISGVQRLRQNSGKMRGEFFAVFGAVAQHHRGGRPVAHGFAVLNRRGGIARKPAEIGFELEARQTPRQKQDEPSKIHQNQHAAHGKTVGEGSKPHLPGRLHAQREKRSRSTANTGKNTKNTAWSKHAAACDETEFQKPRNLEKEQQV